MAAEKLHERLMHFRHGVHPEEYKGLSDHRAIERMPFVREYTLPLSQHLGAPSRLIVRKGEEVRRGQMIAAPDGFLSVALHSPVDGKVIYVGPLDHPNGQVLPGVRIKTDPFSPQLMEKPAMAPFSRYSTEDFLKAVQQAGIVGLGGAAFPAHVKFSVPKDKSCRVLMLNGSECEPFLTCDHRLMLEYADDLLEGTAILQHFLSAERIVAGIEANKPDAIALLRSLAVKKGLPLEVLPLEVKYPQGAEKMMISAVLGVEVPSGKLPIDIGALVANVGTIVALSHYFREGRPLIERVVTVTGTAVRRPSNLLIPIGTPMREVVDYCGGLTHEAVRILLGGPMMGISQKTLDVPVVKGTSGILLLTSEEVRDLQTFNCIRCGRCLEACPIFLNPARMGVLVKKGQWQELEEMNVMDCFECGSCSYVCPSAIPLVQSFRVGKSVLREQRAMALAYK
jgi:electron transport complex protein RnfC